MAGDFSRSSINKVKSYAGVLMQQGRVQVDADWNEQLALQMARTVAETVDVIGKCGTNKVGDGFKITNMDGLDLLIHPGQYWVNGVLCELAPQQILVEPSLNSGTQVNLPSLLVDDRTVAVGDWVELSAMGAASIRAQVTAVDATPVLGGVDDIIPSYFVVTLSKSLGSLLNAAPLWLKRVVTFTTQPFLLNQWDATLETSPAQGIGSVLNLPQGDYVVVLEAWQREVSALVDPHIREVALGGPDTCERLQNVWQVHLIPYGGESSPPDSPLASPPEVASVDCCTSFPGFDQYKASLTTTGLMNAQVAQGSQSPPPCLPITPTGYLGVSNQLYRVEVFQPGTANSDATFVWSRDNAMVETTIVCIDSAGNVYASDLGKDDLHSFGLNDYVEIVDPDGELEGLPRFLATIGQTPIASVTPPCSLTAAPAYQLTLNPPPPSRFQGKSNLRLRRWDMPQTQTMLPDANGNPLGIQIISGWLTIENNIEVNFSNGYYATASYWQIPARTATGDIEWPPYVLPNTNPIPQSPLGITHNFCRLAIVSVEDGALNVTDCRCKFPSLTNICAEDICYHGTGCELEPVSTLTEALDELAARIRYHNKMLHGTGVVCGLGVSCGGGTTVKVAKGYAIDCEGYDLRVEKPVLVNFANLLLLSPQENQIPDGSYELILERGYGGIETFDRMAFDGAPINVDRDPIDLGAAADRGCCSKSTATLTPDKCFKFRAIPCTDETFARQWLDGTLLKDFVDRCIMPLVKQFQSEYQGQYISSDKIVTTTEALLSSAFNLIIQLGTPSLNEVYISSQEATLLSNLYTWLYGLLKDKTFCALKANLRPFPTYDQTLQDTGMTTLFGKGLKTRLRVSADGTRGYAMGGNAEIQVFDLGSMQLANVIQMPGPGGATGWVVKDVAIAQDGTISVVATNNTDSYFAQGAVAADFGITWSEQGALSGLAFDSLASVLTADVGQGVYGTVPGKGIYFINTADANAVNATQVAQSAVTGQIVSWGQFLLVTTNSTGAAGTFDEVALFVADTGANGGVQKDSQTFALTGATGNLTDDLAICSAEGDFPLSFVVSALNSSTQDKELIVFNGIVPGGEASQPVSLGVNTTVRLAATFSTNSGPDKPVLAGTVMVSLEGTCQLQMLTVGQNQPTLSPYAPSELHPTSLAYGENTGGLFVLNSTCNTITAIPQGTPAFSAEVLSDLQAYRQSAVDAYTDLLFALLQSLKDCFCDLLLPDCPSCDEDEEGVALACVTMFNGTVQKICNLEKRKYVKTFPNVGYWLSLLPLIPLAKVLVEDLCCLVFKDLITPHPVAPPSNNFAKPPLFTASGEQMRSFYTKVSTIKVADVITAAKQRVAPVGKLTLDAVTAPFKQSSAAPQAKLNGVPGMSVSDAKATLAADQINVAATQDYNPRALSANMASYVAAPAALPAGSSVTLVVDANQQVRYYVPTPPVVTDLSSTVQSNQAAVLAQINTVTTTGQELDSRLTADEKVSEPALNNVQALQSQVATLQTQLTTLQTTNAQALATRDQQIAALTTSTQELQTKLSVLNTLSAQVQALAARMPIVNTTLEGPKE